MDHRDQWSGIFWLLISVLVCFQSWQAGIGNAYDPDSGFLPFWSGVLLGIFALALAIRNFVEKKRGDREVRGKTAKWGKVILVIAALLVYAILLPILGYLIGTFGLMLILFRVIEKPKLWIQIAGAVITSLITYIVFYVWLGVHVPTGLLGF